MDIIAIQIDLGRQKEHISYIKQLVEKAKKWGYNTVFLYLECSIRTQDTQCFDPDDTYSLEELKEIVDFIVDCGMDAIPAFENFYHIEKLLQYDEFKHFAEFENEHTMGRGFAKSWFEHGEVGCTSNPEFNKFFDKYISDVCSIFPGKYVHMGLDEIFEFGECPRCKKRIADGSSKKQIYFEQVMHNYELAKKIGKRMMMWDDFFEYFDIVADLPRDILLCHWNYIYIGSETKGHWTNRVRKDWLTIYDELGFEYLFCAYGSDKSSTYNVDTLTDYAIKHNPKGAILTIWERAASFYLGIYPLIAYTGALWSGNAVYEDDKENIYKELLGEELAARTLCNATILNAFTMNTDVANRAEDDNACKSIYRNLLENAARDILLVKVLRSNNSNRDILRDIYDNILETLLRARLNALGTYIFDGYEMGIMSEYVFKQLDDIEKGFREINKNAKALWTKYRKGLKSSHGLFERVCEERANIAKKTKENIKKNFGCGVFYLDMMTPDGYGTPKIRIFAKYEGETEEKKVYEGGVKPDCVTFDVGGCHTIRFVAENKKMDYVRLEAYGEDSLFVCSLRHYAKGKKYYPTAVENLGGRVINEQNILIPDSRFAEFGYNDGLEHLNELSLSKKVSTIKVIF